MLSALIHKGAGADRGFSLLELLLALALVAVLSAFALDGYTSMAQATALTTGADMINDALNEARQDAVTAEYDRGSADLYWCCLIHFDYPR